MPTEPEPPVIEAELVEEESAALTVARPAVLEAQERAQVDVMIQQAERKPRGEIALIRQRLISLVTEDVETAEDCFYTLRRKDRQSGETKLIQGPGVRLAQLALSCWKNARAASRIIENDGKKVTSQGFCYDVETNVMISTEVSRRITGRNGRTFSEDMQIVTANAANAIARRNAIFEVIPRTLVNAAYEAAKKAAVGDQKTLDQKRQSVLGRFGAMGVTRDQILRLLGKETVESIDLEALELLIGLGTAIKDKTISIDEAFAESDDAEPDEARLPLKERLRVMREGKKKSRTEEQK